VEAQPDLPGREDLGRQQVTPPGREHVVMVGGRAAAGQRQPAQVGRGRGLDQLRVQAGPDRIQRGQPAEQGLVGRVAAGDPLVQVVMGVDQAGRGQQAGAVDPLGRGVVRRHRAGPDRRDPVPVEYQVSAGVFGSRRVHRRDVAAVDDQHVS
jgi:hypothetical protein